jgi:predicted RND superfamily exporter protein
MPDVQVTQDPFAVYAIVGLIAGAAVLALLLASPVIARVPKVRSRDDGASDRSPHMTERRR